MAGSRWRMLPSCCEGHHWRSISDTGSMSAQQSSSCGAQAFQLAPGHGEGPLAWKEAILEEKEKGGEDMINLRTTWHVNEGEEPPLNWCVGIVDNYPAAYESGWWSRSPPTWLSSSNLTAQGWLSTKLLPIGRGSRMWHLIRDEKNHLNS